jgi:hypothetical protein
MKITQKNHAVLFLLFFLLPFAAFADPDIPVVTPIDGGVSFLLAAGAAYGAKKIYDWKKNKEEE